MSDRYTDIKTKLCQLAEKDDDIRAVIAIGSSTRENSPADQFSDLDLIIVTESPESWYSGEYPAKLGEVSISFIEPTLGGGKERRCIYGADRDVDMMIFTPEQFDKALKDGVAEWVMDRGYALLCDKGSYTIWIPRYVSPKVSREVITEEEFVNLVNDFYFHNIWAYKKLKRGEMWSAVMCINGYLKVRLLKVIEQYHMCIYGRDVWHDGRFLDSWADPFVAEDLEECFARYYYPDCVSAIEATHLLFARLARELAEKLGYHYPKGAEKCAAEYLGI